MNSKFILLVCLFAIIHTGFSRPRSKSLGDSEAEAKDWEISKPDVSLLKKLERSGVGVKRSLLEEKEDEDVKLQLVEDDKAGSLKSGADEELEASDLPDSEDPTAARVKKQSPNNVCIKLSCGKTVCGPIVSARGPVAGDMRAMMQGLKHIPGMHEISAGLSDPNAASGKMDHFSQVHGRTVDLMGLAPLSLGYGTPAVLTAPVAAAPVSAPVATPIATPIATPVAAPIETSALGYGHSFLKPQAVSAVPAVPVAVVSQHHQPHQLLHPWVMPHLMSHLMPHVMSSVVPSLTSYVTPHRFEPQRYPEVIPQSDVKPPPPPPMPHFSYPSSDTALVCQPVRNQRFDNALDYIYKPDLSAIDKSLNISEAGKRIQGSDDDAKIQDHLRKVNEIKDEITQLNRAAQRIVDQQERLTEMQHKQLWSSSPMSSMSQHGAEHPATNSYMGSGYYSHPTMPWGYSRSNILSYPNSHDDIDFFLNLLRAGRKIGVISDSLQPMLSNTGDMMKSAQETAKSQKEIPETAANININARKIEDVKAGAGIKSG